MNKPLTILLIIAGVIAGALFATQCDRLKDKQFVDIGDSTELLRDNLAISRATILELNARNSKLLIEDKALRKELTEVKSRIKIETYYSFDTIFVPVSDTMIITLSDSTPALRLPWNWKWSDEWTYIQGEINQSGLTIDSLSQRSSLTVYLADRKRGFLKSPSLVAIVQDNSPYAKIKSIESVVVQPPKKFWNTGAFKFLTGVATGIILISIAK